MAEHLFFLDDLSSDHVELPAEEARHALNVLRLKDGDRVALTDGRGLRCQGSISSISKNNCVLRIEERIAVAAERRARIHIAIAPTKSIDRYEWFLEKATEIGIDRITPIITAHSERRKLRHDRSLKVLIAAMKQSQRSWLPTLDELIGLNEFLQQGLADECYFGWCEGDHQPLMGRYTQKDSLVVIGPEGDFSAEEAEQMMAAGLRPVTIGATRLRTETAALAACTWMSLAQQTA